MQTITGEPERDLGSVEDKCGIVPFDAVERESAQERSFLVCFCLSSES